MPWLSNQRAALAALALAVTIGSLQAPVGAQEPMFLNRAVNPAAKTVSVSPAVRDQYNSIFSEKSLLIPFCIFPIQAQICPDSTFYSLDAVFGAAAAGAGLNAGATAKRWFRDATEGPMPPFGSAPLTSENMLQSFQLLAVVNRLDFATWSDRTQKWSNAELRFIYGLKPVPAQAAHFTLIVEFVLPDADWTTFQKQAQQWRNLSQPANAASSVFPGALGNVIEQTGYRKSTIVRIRANCQMSGSQWGLSEWVFQSRTATTPPSFNRSHLDFQVSNSYINPELGIAPTLAQERLTAYTHFWTDFMAKTNITAPLQPDSKLATVAEQYAFNSDFLNPPPTLLDSPKLRSARNVIALQQCTRCHSRETNTQLQHVSESGAVSAFLAPNGNWNPKLEDLIGATPAVLPVPIRYCVTQSSETLTVEQPGPHCVAPQVEVHDTRHFHDLARRKLFMATLLAAPPAGPGPTDILTIMQNAPDFAH
jgi:hypothetical protein